MAKKVWGKDVYCSTCKFYRGFTDKNQPSCKAYPDKIPFIIISGGVDHRNPYKGDNGIRFEEKE